MKIPEKYVCDICKLEIINFSSGKHTHSIPVWTNCEWEEGKHVKRHIRWQHYDICEKCLEKIVVVECGYRGLGPKIIKE